MFFLRFWIEMGRELGIWVNQSRVAACSGKPFFVRLTMTTHRERTMRLQAKTPLLLVSTLVLRILRLELPSCAWRNLRADEAWMNEFSQCPPSFYRSVGRAPQSKKKRFVSCFPELRAHNHGTIAEAIRNNNRWWGSHDARQEDELASGDAKERFAVQRFEENRW